MTSLWNGRLCVLLFVVRNTVYFLLPGISDKVFYTTLQNWTGNVFDMDASLIGVCMRNDLNLGTH